MKVTAYKSQSGIIHENELDCLMDDFQTEMRGVIQSDISMRIHRSDTITVQSAANIMVRHSDQVAAVIRKYTNKIRGYNNRNPQNVSVTM